jgi:hypothetical protein
MEVELFYDELDGVVLPQFRPLPPTEQQGGRPE